MKVISQIYVVIIIASFLPITAEANVKTNSKIPKQGEWMQFVESNHTWKPGGVYSLYKKNGIYLMTPVQQSTDKKTIDTRGLFNISISDNHWQFKSAWGKGVVGTFKLTRMTDGAYSGWSYLTRKKMNRNIWLRIK